MNTDLQALKKLVVRVRGENLDESAEVREHVQLVKRIKDILGEKTSLASSRDEESRTTQLTKFHKKRDPQEVRKKIKNELKKHGYKFGYKKGLNDERYHHKDEHSYVDVGVGWRGIGRDFKEIPKETRVHIATYRKGTVVK